MKRHELLRGLHQVIVPRTYLEIGVRNGLSLALSRARTVAVDPAFAVNQEVRCDMHLVRASSDEFFARRNPLSHLGRRRVDLAFVDGMHLAEFALRDFINIEPFTHPASVVVLDDVLPRTVLEGGRGRVGPTAHGAWAGDVYKVAETFRALRPDLLVLEVDTTPTGTLVVLVPDRRSRVLPRAYDDLVPSYVAPDPQAVPERVLARAGAVPAEALLDSSVWATIRRLRNLPPEVARPLVRGTYVRAGLASGLHA